MKFPWLFDIEPLWGLTDTKRFTHKISQASRGQHTVVWHVVWENYTYQPEAVKTLIQETRLVNPTVQIVLLADRWYEPNRQSFVHLGFDQTVFIDFFALATWARIKKINQQLNKSWSPDNGKFLFLTGKPNKINRIRLLWKLGKERLLDRSTWSLFVPNEMYDSCQQILPEIDADEFYSFVQANKRSPDIDDVTGFCGLPFDVELYHNSLFQIISETHFGQQRPWITEKTWLAVLNRLPFIMAGNVDTLKYLQTVYKLRTFEQYLPRSDYDTIVESEKRLDAIVENTHYLLQNASKKAQEINHDVEHNYKQTMLMIHQNQLAIADFLRHNNLTGTCDGIIEEIDDFNMQHGCFYTWYENIRDPSWPDCANAQQWHDLPDAIKRECVEIFGYNPKVQKEIK